MRGLTPLILSPHRSYRRDRGKRLSRDSTELSFCHPSTSPSTSVSLALFFFFFFPFTTSPRDPSTTLPPPDSIGNRKQMSDRCDNILSQRHLLLAGFQSLFADGAPSLHTRSLAFGKSVRLQMFRAPRCRISFRRFEQADRESILPTLLLRPK